MTVKQQDKSKIVQIWGDILDEGFTSVPNILLRYRSNLRIKSHLVLLIIDIMSFKWDEENPFPSYSTLARRAGMTERGVKKTVRELERLNLLIRTQRFDEETGAQITTIFDFRPLVQRLTEEMKKAKIGYKPSTTDKKKTHKREREDEKFFTLPMKNSSEGGGELQFTGGGELQFTGRGNYSSSGGVNYSSPKEDSYNNKTQITKTHYKVGSAENEKNQDLEAASQVEDEKERVRTYFRNGIFRKRLFEIYDNLRDIKSIEELVEEGAYKACKEIMVNRVNDLSKNGIKINPDRIAEEVKLEFPYHKVPRSYEKARKFFVANVSDLTANKVSELLEGNGL